MEIKTCEHYVLDRLNEMENKVFELENTLQEKEELLNILLKYVNKEVSILKSDPTKRYIDFETIWESYNKDDFNRLKKLLNL